ncbi:MAG TPA: thymidine kinase [Phycisphaerae bacterium]|nr:thymidine kinase [Phycisphaerae bacterium]
MSDATAEAKGRIEVIAGSMFSGKTERLIARLRNAQTEGRHVGAFKHRMDDRYDPEHLITHTQDRFPAARVAGADEIVERSGELDTIGIDEGHFFGRPLIEVVRGLTDSARRVLVVGLEYDAWGRPFVPMAQLAEMADEVLHMYAPCRVCGGQARYSQRMVPVGTQTMVGGADLYQPRCQRCFEPLASPPPEQD